jgi:hypothetical protein
MKAGVLFLVVLGVACGPSQDLGPAVTCSDVSLTTDTGSCSLIANSACSDGQLYEIDCQDDSTCTCTENGSIGASIIASNSPAGFCASVTTSAFHDLAAKCGWNLNP